VARVPESIVAPESSSAAIETATPPEESVAVRPVVGGGGTMVMGSKRASNAPPSAASGASPERVGPSGTEPLGAAAAEARAASAPSKAAPSADAGDDVWAHHDGGAPSSRSSKSSKSGPHPHPTGYMPSGDNATMSGVSLAGIGVQPSARAYGLLAVIAMVLIGLGALATYFIMQTGEPVEAAADASPPSDDPDDVGDLDNPDEVVVGMPIPDGVAPPDDDGSSSGVGPDRPTMGSGGTSSPTTMGTTAGGTTTMSATMSTATTMGGTSSGSTTMAATMNTSGSTTMDTSGSTTMDTGTTGGGDTSGGSTSMSSGGDVEERDIAMELYASRVRFLISRYYAVQAQSCFEDATRNNPSVRGTVVVAFTIGADGQVTRSSVASNSTGISTLGSCIANRVRTWRLTATPDGTSIDLTMPFSR
jgi:TonB family protein